MTKITKLKCIGECGKEMTMNSFYVSHSWLYKNNSGRMPICKECFYNEYRKLLIFYNDEVKALYHICMKLDIYYDKELINKSQENIANDELGLLKTYMKNVNSLRQYKGKCSVESTSHEILDVNAINEIEEKYLDIIEEYKNSKVVDEEDYDFDSIKIPGHVKKRWGSGYTNEEYLYLEDNYMEFYDTYSHETPAEKMLLMNISRSLLEGERSRKAGKIKDYENMMKLVSSMLTDANIKPSQKKNKGDEIGECFGVFIENIEKNEPIGEAIDEFEDADGIGKLFERQFVRNFARVFGLVGDNDENED
ncbi:MAG: hypothetical protein ACRC18_07140 [Cetobacterium sp.]